MVHPFSTGASSPSSVPIIKDEGVLKKQQQLWQDMTKTCLNVEDNVKKLKTLSPKCVVILMGPVGQGKSTLMNFLAGEKLLSKAETGNQYSIEVPNAHVEGMEVYSDKVGTKIPRYYYDKETHYAFYDSPGFRGLTGEEQLRTTFVLKKMFTLLNPLPIQIFLVNGASRENWFRTSPFIATIKNLSEFFKADIKAITDRLSVIITKAGENDQARDIYRYIDKVLEPIDDAITLRADEIAILNRMKACPIAFFPSPLKKGRFNPDPKVKTNISEMISEDYTSIAIIPTLSLAAEGQVTVSRLTNSLVAEITDYINKTFEQRIVDFCLQELSSETNSDEVRNTFGTLKKALQEMRDVGDTTNTSFKASLNAFRMRLKAICNASCSIEGSRDVINTSDGGSVKKKKNKQSLTKKNVSGLIPLIDKDFSFVDDRLEALSQLQELDEADTMKKSFKAWAEAFARSRELAAQLSEKPKFDTDTSNKTLTCSAVFLGCGDIMSTFDAKLHKKIILYLGHTFYCDTGLTLPGVSLIIVAPYWTISGNRTISLKGKDAENDIAAQTESIHDDHTKGAGKDGMPGAPGQHGGHMVSQHITMTGVDKLTVNTSGGNGGSGANGRNGADTKNEVEADADQSITKDEPGRRSMKVNTTRALRLALRNKYSKVWNEMALYPFRNRVFDVTYILSKCVGKGTPGKNGKNGGRGGEGGYGGSAGTITFSDLVHAISQDGKKGNDGKPGNGGKGSQGGRHAAGSHFKNVIVVSDERCALSCCTVEKANNELLDKVIENDEDPVRYEGKADDGIDGETPTRLVAAASNTAPAEHIHVPHHMAIRSQWRADVLKDMPMLGSFIVEIH